MKNSNHKHASPMNKEPIYLDYNATTPIDPEVAEAMLPYLYEHFGNPSSIHPYGKATRRAIDHARQQVASLINCQSDEIIFTSGGTESNNMVIKGVAQARQTHGNHIIVSSVEHPAILEPCAYLADYEYKITHVPVNHYGQVSPNDIEKALTPATILISIMLANNEVGTLQPVQEISRLAHARDVLMHTDAAQAIGKIPVDVQHLDIDYLTIAGHKLYAPKGIGALYIRSTRSLPKFMHGASHELNRRAGTENVLGIVGLGQAAEIAGRDLQTNMHHMQAMRDRLLNGLRSNIDNLQRNGHPEHCLPNTLSVSFQHVEANTLLEQISVEVAASAGAACHADQVTVSTVLKAMNLSLDYAMGTIRFTTGKATTPADIDRTVKIVAEAVSELRS
jgi:cysteine desulfurase